MRLSKNIVRLVVLKPLSHDLNANILLKQDAIKAVRKLLSNLIEATRLRRLCFQEFKNTKKKKNCSEEIWLAGNQIFQSKCEI